MENNPLDPKPVAGTMFLYTIFDTNLREYSAPMAFESEGALDQFVKLLVRTHSYSRQHTHPEDFAVFRIAEFDPEDGVLLTFTEKQFVNSFSAYKLPKCKFCEADDLRKAEILEDDISITDPSFKEGDF